MKSRVQFALRQRPLLYAALSILIVTCTAFAQSDMPGATSMGNGGGNSIQGDIIGPSGQRLDRPVMVRLNTVRGELTTTSNGNGSFAFRGLTGGRYIVKIEVEGYVP